MSVIAVFSGWPFGAFLCKSTPYLQGVSVCASVYTLAAIALDRYAYTYPCTIQLTIWPISLSLSLSHSLTHIHAHTFIHTHTHARTHARTHAHTHTHIYIYMYTNEGHVGEKVSFEWRSKAGS